MNIFPHRLNKRWTLRFERKRSPPFTSRLRVNFKASKLNSPFAGRKAGRAH